MAETTEILIDREYPWVHLFTDNSTPMTDFPVDSQELQMQVSESQQEVTHLTLSLSKQECLIKQQVEIIATQHNKLQEMKTVSTKTFDMLTQRINDLTVENTTLQKQDTIHQQQPHDVFGELVYAILVQSIINHKAGYKGEAKRKKTLHGVLLWLHQRRNIIVYLKEHNLHQDVTDNLENVLFIDETTLMALLDKLMV